MRLGRLAQACSGASQPEGAVRWLQTRPQTPCHLPHVQTIRAAQARLAVQQSTSEQLCAADSGWCTLSPALPCVQAEQAERAHLDVQQSQPLPCTLHPCRGRPVQAAGHPGTLCAGAHGGPAEPARLQRRPHAQHGHGGQRIPDGAARPAVPPARLRGPGAGAVQHGRHRVQEGRQGHQEHQGARTPHTARLHVLSCSSSCAPARFRSRCCATWTPPCANKADKAIKNIKGRAPRIQPDCMSAAAGGGQTFDARAEAAHDAGLTAGAMLCTSVLMAALSGAGMGRLSGWPAPASSWMPWATAAAGDSSLHAPAFVKPVPGHLPPRTAQPQLKHLRWRGDAPARRRMVHVSDESCGCTLTSAATRRALQAADSTPRHAGGGAGAREAWWHMHPPAPSCLPVLRAQLQRAVLFGCESPHPASASHGRQQYASEPRRQHAARPGRRGTPLLQSHRGASTACQAQQAAPPEACHARRWR